jgi:hypothetical protein
LFVLQPIDLPLTLTSTENEQATNMITAVAHRTLLTLVAFVWVSIGSSNLRPQSELRHLAGINNVNATLAPFQASPSRATVNATHALAYVVFSLSAVSLVKVIWSIFFKKEQKVHSSGGHGHGGH